MAPTSGAHSSAAVPLGFILALVTAAVATGSAADSDGSGRAATASRFLRARPPAELGADLQQALSEALGVGFQIRGGDMSAVKAGLEPMWRTMAKDSQERIDRRSLRYMVQRWFRQKYHISIIGMEALQVNSTSSAAEAKLLAELTPNFVRSVLEGASAEAGFSLEDTAALVAVIERLIVDSGHENLEAAYQAAGFDTTDLLTRDQLLAVIQHYMVRWIFGADTDSVLQTEANQTLFEESIEQWAEFMEMANGFILSFEQRRLHSVASGRAHGSGLKELWNPLRPLFSFADTQALISGLPTQFGHFWETQCEDLMQNLLQSERRGTGRVPLSRFHARALEGEWHFTESAEYLRQLGVLDESSGFHGPQVIASNYMQSPNSCVIAQKHFRVCCASPCHDIYSDLETAIGAPEGAPEDVLAVVSNLTYGLDDADPRISRKLRVQLQEIAQANHGQIPLHGRLFAQWLHFVFPTECPFPHKSNSVSGLSPIEFGVDRFMATVEEMEKNAQRGERKACANGTRCAGAETGDHEDHDSDEFAALWSHEEELLSTHTRLSSRSKPPLLRTTCRLVLYTLATLAVLVLGMIRPAARAIRESGAHGCVLGKLPGGLEVILGNKEARMHCV